MTADLAVAAYRMIPRAVRGVLFRGWAPTSHLYQRGDGWRAAWGLVGDSKPPRPTP